MPVFLPFQHHYMAVQGLGGEQEYCRMKQCRLRDEHVRGRAVEHCPMKPSHLQVAQRLGLKGMQSELVHFCQSIVEPEQEGEDELRCPQSSLFMAGLVLAHERPGL